MPRTKSKTPSTKPARKPRSKKQSRVRKSNKSYSKAKSSNVYSMESLDSVMKGFKSPAPFPSYMVRKLRYADTQTYTVGASGVLGDQQSYFLNSAYDIDETGVGHQPYGYDQMTAIYNRYKVLGVKVKLTITDPTADGIAVCYQITNPSNSTSYINTYSPNTIAEQNMSGMVIINDSGSQKLTKTFYVPIWVASGVTKLQFKADPDNYTADVAGNPGNKIRLLLSSASIRGASSGSVIIHAEFEQTILFYQRKVLAQS